MTRLAGTLHEGSPVEQDTIRELVTAVIVYAKPSRPGGALTRASVEDDRSVRIEIKGRLAAICGEPAIFPDAIGSGGMLVRERALPTFRPSSAKCSRPAPQPNGYVERESLGMNALLCPLK